MNLNVHSVPIGFVLPSTCHIDLNVPTRYAPIALKNQFKTKQIKSFAPKILK